MRKTLIHRFPIDGIYQWVNNGFMGYSPINGDGSYREEQQIPKPRTGGFCRSWTLTSSKTCGCDRQTVGLGTRHFRCPSRAHLSNFLFSLPLLFLAQGANFESRLGSSLFLRHHIENPGACIASQARHSGAMRSHGSNG